MHAAALPAVVAVALLFAWTNGVHDAATAVATSLTTRSLTPRVALALAGGLNAVGALLGVDLARTIGTQILDQPLRAPGLAVVLSGLVGAIVWNLLTWAWGVPSSSSQALIGGLAGAGLAAGVAVDWGVVGTKVLVPMVVSPLAGLVLARLFMAALARGFRAAAHGRALRRFRVAQTVSAAAMALGHGLQDGQKTMGVVVLALAAEGRPSVGVPWWVRVAVALALGVGTYAGGWSIIRTLGRRVVRVDPVTGFAAEAVAAGVLYAAASVFTVPVSSTHTVTASILGAGSYSGLRGVRWRTVRAIALAWAVTLPAAGLLAAVCHLALAAAGR